MIPDIRTAEFIFRDFHIPQNGFLAVLYLKFFFDQCFGVWTAVFFEQGGDPYQAVYLRFLYRHVSKLQKIEKFLLK